MSTKNRGFASLDKDKLKEIASRGGKAVHKRGTGHEWDSAEARDAGRLGGKKVSQDRKHMAEIGRRGGEARGVNKRKARAEQQKTPDNAPLVTTRVPHTNQSSDKHSPYDTQPMSRGDFEDTYGFDPQSK